MKTLLWSNTLLVLALHAADEWLTWQGLHLGGRERNPLARPLMGSPGLSISTKAIGALIIALALAVLCQGNRRLFWGAALFHHAVMGAVLVNNSAVLRWLQEHR